jgi:hypothetical protein
VHLSEAPRREAWGLGGIRSDLWVFDRRSLGLRRRLLCWRGIRGCRHYGSAVRRVLYWSLPWFSDWFCSGTPLWLWLGVVGSGTNQAVQFKTFRVVELPSILATAPPDGRFALWMT